MHRADGLFELRGREGENEVGGGCVDVRARELAAWLARPGRIAISTQSGYFDSFALPISIREESGSRVVEVMSDTIDRRCVGIGESPGERVPIDLPEQRTMGSWVGIEATDETLRLDFRYLTGGCTYERSGDRTLIELPDGQGEIVDERMFERGDTRGARFDVRGGVLLVTAPCGGGCAGLGSDPTLVDEPAGATRLKQVVPLPARFVHSRIIVPATADRVVVRPDCVPPPPCE